MAVLCPELLCAAFLLTMMGVVRANQNHQMVLSLIPRATAEAAKAHKAKDLSTFSFHFHLAWCIVD